jgi:glycosyltransferase involved in cell wall biosynthesis
MKRPSIAIAVIARNEASNVRQWFASVEGLFDQYVFVDTGSNDGTQDIAKELGCDVFHFPWCDDFSAARNYAFDQVKTDFVFWNDLDDVLENREAFIQFRDNIMKIADFWIAPYHYASDGEGRPVCTFARERVFRMSRQPRWRYFIHEGVVPSPHIPTKIQMISSWQIRHKRTQEDLNKDHGRNLAIFERNMKRGPLDARMRYYYGKELFENKMVKEAIGALNSANADPSLEIHDRVLAIQYLCFAYMAEENWSKAIEFAHSGLMLDPTRAEFYCVLGDSYLKSGDVRKALPYFTATKGCMKPEGSGMQPIFFDENAYGVYPKEQLARAYFHMGDLCKARLEAIDAISIKPSPENRAILMELDRVYGTLNGYKNAKPCDDIVFTTPPQHAYPFDPEIASQKAMGGSETALIEMAYWMKNLTGRTVKVFSQRRDDRMFDGVEYLSNDKLPEYMTVCKPSVHIAWRHNIQVTNAPTYVWCHDLFTPGGENHAIYEKMMCLTPFHKTFVQSMQSLPDEKIWVTRNGLNPDKFKSEQPIEKDPWKFVFSSSPDRGLDRAMRVLDKVREKYPEIKLHVYYGIEHLDKWGHADLKKKLKQMMDERKGWVVYHGATEQKKLMEEFRSAAYCVQPSDFIETSMISAIERLCCGVYQIIRAVGGCVDTLRDAAKQGMATLVDSECVTESEHQAYVDATIQAIEEEAYKRVSADPETFSWKGVAEEWIQTIPGLSKGKTEAA